jgi:UDP-N-acetylglucosamine 1-carboxyvinyltransferase
MITVTGTENFMMAARLAEGETILENPAQEPEITDLGDMLNAMGARIEGHGTGRIRIQGVDKLHGATHRVVADRIECGTFLCAVAATGGDVLLKDAGAEHLEAVIDLLRSAGAEVQAVDGGVACARRAGSRPRASGPRNTRGFATDMQGAVHGAQLHFRRRCQDHQTIFENRFMHVSELIAWREDRRRRQGRHHPRVARLSGAIVMATDLRASASLVIAGLVADGETLVDRIYHLDRGYDQMEAKLRGSAPTSSE